MVDAPDRNNSDPPSRARQLPQSIRLPHSCHVRALVIRWPSFISVCGIGGSARIEKSARIRSTPSPGRRPTQRCPPPGSRARESTRWAGSGGQTSPAPSTRSRLRTDGVGFRRHDRLSFWWKWSARCGVLPLENASLSVVDSGKNRRACISTVAGYPLGWDRYIDGN